MALLCELCQTANRDGAKFCKGCGRKIAQSWPVGEAATLAVGDESLALMGATAGLGASDPDRSARGHAGATAQAPYAPATPPESDPTGGGGSSRSRRLLIIPAAGAALFAVAVAWFAMSHRSEVVSEAPTVPLVSAQEMSQGTTQQAAKLAPPAPAEALVEVPVSPPPTGDAAAAMNSSKPGPDSAADVKPKPTRKPMARKPAPAPEPVQASPPPVVAPAPPAPPAPQEACAGLNFVAKSRCLVAQCARPEQKAHPQCQAVREQQRLEEEKRNPQLVN